MRIITIKIYSDRCSNDCNLSVSLGRQVQAVVVVGPEGGVALGTLPLARLVARAQTVPAEHVETLRQHRVFALYL